MHVELWGGIECTVNRVGDTYFDQLRRNGHHGRPDDLDRIAALGLKRLRYPVLWERTAPERLKDADWRWPDERLKRLRGLGLQPIVGLLHHGSGPPHTSLIDPAFPAKLGDYAAAVAERYPWVTDYTPVNEPLTTARFSGLYGHWYPHGRDNPTFLRALIQQVLGIRASMKAIRQVQPRARLIQTEDLGRVFCTPSLVGQAEFENHRRWLSLDLLFGRVTPEHPLWGFLLCHRVDEAALRTLMDDPCPPDVVGINYYCTSDRYLDEDWAGYPVHYQGGNGVQAYADIEAYRTSTDDAVLGHRPRLAEACDRYGQPVALTEVHLGGPRDEQLRWLFQAWEASQQLRDSGRPVSALTVWSLLGSYDWQVLVTRETGFYESGVFDLRGIEPRPTALARMIQALARGERFTHPVLNVSGWWQRPDRLLGGPEAPVPVGERPILVVGRRGTLARAFLRVGAHRGLPMVAVGRDELDIADYWAVRECLETIQPWAVVNTAGYVRVDAAEQNRHPCWRVNVTGAAHLAEVCGELGLPFVTYSTDLVFDGDQETPYVESDPIGPLNVYGLSKAMAEEAVLLRHPEALVVRTSAFFGPWDEANFVTQSLKRLAAGHTVTAAADVVVSPTYVPDLVHASLDLLLDGERQRWHLAHPVAVSWADLARRAAALAGLPTEGVQDAMAESLSWVASRPRFSAMASQRCALLPALDDALTRYRRESTWARELAGVSSESLSP